MVEFSITESHTSAQEATADGPKGVDSDHLAQIRQISAEFAPSGVLHLVLEVLAYCVDDAAQTPIDRRCVIRLHSDGSISVMDNDTGTENPGIATKDPEYFDSPGTELLSDGFSRRGLSVVTALSDWLIRTQRQAHRTVIQRFDNGLFGSELVEAANDRNHGTTVHFLPNDSLREGFPIDANQLQELAVFPFLKVEVVDERITPPASNEN